MQRHLILDLLRELPPSPLVDCLQDEVWKLLELCQVPLQPILGKPRSPLWETVRREFLKENSSCAACGGRKSLQVHHILPYHLFPDQELNRDNLITLCDAPYRHCHFIFGHLYNYSDFNPRVREHACEQLRRLNDRSYSSCDSPFT